jgi:hypothetical protein
VRDDAAVTTTERIADGAVAASRGLPDPNVHPPTVAESADPFSALRVVHLIARLPRGEPIPLGDVVARLNAEYSDWSFSKRVVADVVGQLRANWIADYRTVDALQLEDGPGGTALEIEDSARTGPWLVEQAQRFASACHEALDEFARGEGRATEG